MSADPVKSNRWPCDLWLIRHGQSAGNVARDLAHDAGELRIALDHRDVDIPLSALGGEQAKALGHWFSQESANGQPEVVLSSPYVRALQTAQIFREAGGCDEDVAICIDERLREKEFGILDGLTTSGVGHFEPDQARFRAVLGKFYHRPPGGESWVDVIFRLRALLDTVSLHYAGKRVMIIAHQVVVLCMRYILERMTEAEILSIDGQGDVANCSVTHYRLDESTGHLKLERYNVTAPLRQEGTETTSEPDQMVAARG